MDLNLLVALDALLAEGSVTGAAERLQLSVPAMSRTLERIRRMMGDPLFVRAGRGLVPTPRAEALREPVRTLVAQARELLAQDAAFDLKTLRRVFTIRADDGAVSTPGRPCSTRWPKRRRGSRCASSRRASRTCCRCAKAPSTWTSA